LPDDECLVEVPEVVERDPPAQPVRSHELTQLLHDVLQQLGMLLPRPLVEPNGEPGERRVYLPNGKTVDRWVKIVKARRTDRQF
jgi:hypothetical protein